MIKPLESPNLPKSRVCDVAVSGYSEKLNQKLKELNINSINTVNSRHLDTKINYHTDLLVNNIAQGIIMLDNTQSANIVKYLTIGYKCEYLKNTVTSPYPSECLLNCVVVGDKLICNPDTADKKLAEYAHEYNYNIISVNQGYTKCSICIVSDNALITDDESVYYACNKNKIDSLYISKGSINLNGYDYGFIGGCTGLIDRNKLLFNGDINYHKDCNKIIDFLNIYNIKPFIIENEPLTDIGSILPLTEENRYIP